MDLIPEADFGMIGEGEVTSVELVNALQSAVKCSEKEIRKIPGLIVRKSDGTLYCTRKREDIENLDALPFPDWEGFRLVETCLKYAKEDNSIVAPIVSSRSCPNSCTFCSKTGGKKYRQRSLENIFLEINELVNKYHVNKLNFSDELFAENPNRLFQFCDMIEPYHISYRVSMHIGKNLCKELLSRMYESGCKVIFYGLESADNNVLKSMRKHITIDDISRCLRATKEAGIIAEGNFIFGDPAETEESVQTTLNWIKENYMLGVFEVAAIKLYPGSQLYDDAVSSGKIKNQLKFIMDGCPLVNVSGLSEERYIRMVNQDLTTVQKMRLRRQEGLTLEKKEKDIVGKSKCSCCGKEIKFKLKNRSQVLRMYTEHCMDCGALEYLNLFPVYYDKIILQMEYLIKNKKVAIFGCGNVWKMFYSIGNIFQECEYVIIDETPFLQKEGWNGRKVFPVGVLNTMEIDTMIVMLRTSKKEIQEKLESKYNIKNINIIMCYDLM